MSERNDLPANEGSSPKKPAPEAADSTKPKRSPQPSGEKRSASGNGQSSPNVQKRPPQKRPSGSDSSGRPHSGQRPHSSGSSHSSHHRSKDGAPVKKRPPQSGHQTHHRTGSAAHHSDNPKQNKPKNDLDFGKHSTDKKTQPETQNSGKKGGFTKKQALTVAALILILLLILALVVVLILWHYFGLFDRDHKDRTTSEAMVYSDVDFSRPDTLDKVSEDQKLKELTAQAEKISNKDVMNILLIGEDLRDTAEESTGNTDVMMIISVNTKDKTITQTSVMRDCYVGFEDENGYWWYSRINAAYHYGGIKLTRSTIENYLNVKIDRYVLVNFNVFIDIVDTLGGLDMYVSDDEANGYPDADPNGDNTRGMQNPLDEQNKYLHNKKGTDYIKKGGDLHLNGNQALAYARLRHVGNSDWERTERQRKVIAEMIKKSRSMSLVDMDRLANKIFPQIKTDVTSTEMAQLLIDMLDYRNYKIQELRVPADDTYTNQVINGMDVLSVDFPTNAQMFKKLVYGSIELDDSSKEKKQNIE
ncbi:transcriptional attenuator, LytR family [Ruminococcus sp. YE71]|uniref:LCP family protein n=1 Tax=unclassified Ruminococcus TaxID=2608920 RepID=UPI00088B5F34|nr:MULTISPECIES: LCP family protein [unclassified Ruminococcus]SDA22674.1 transcriptional attenuator, LytR family [Ruminococcus sp. YE78]SFW38580.1 transcriptional attenuator, LytR family [Ruminococcus sp. YE71]